MASSNTTSKPSITLQPCTSSFMRRRSTGSGGDSSPPTEPPVVILRVQILSCYDAEANDPKGYSDPFVKVSLLGRHFQTPVSKHNFNPAFAPKDATFDFPIYTSLMHKLGPLEFVVRDKDVIRSDQLGLYTLPVDQWFEGTAFAFDDLKNQPFFVDLVSSRSNTTERENIRTNKTVRGTMCIKVGFVHPPGPAGSPGPDFGKTYNALLTTAKDYAGVVLLEISHARDLPKWPNMIRLGWDMDPFVQVSIGDEVQRTSVIKHSLNPVWNEQLSFYVRERSLSLPIHLAVFDHDRFTANDLVGTAEISISILVEMVANKDLTTDVHPGDVPITREFDIPLTRNLRRAYTCTPTIRFRLPTAHYATDIDGAKSVTPIARKRSCTEPTLMHKSPSSTLPTESVDLYRRMKMTPARLDIEIISRRDELSCVMLTLYRLDRRRLHPKIEELTH